MMRLKKLCLLSLENRRRRVVWYKCSNILKGIKIFRQPDNDRKTRGDNIKLRRQLLFTNIVVNDGNKLEQEAIHSQCKPF